MMILWQRGSGDKYHAFDKPLSNTGHVRSLCGRAVVQYGVIVESKPKNKHCCQLCLKENSNIPLSSGGLDL